MLNLDKRPGFTVAAAPQRHELVAGLCGPCGGLQQVRHPNAEFAGLGVKHLDRCAGGDLLAKTVLCLKHHAIGAFLEREVKAHLTAVVSGESLLGDDLAQLPGIDVGSIRLRLEFRREHTHALGHDGVAIATERGAFHLGRWLERVELDRAFRLLADAVERRGTDAHTHVLACHLPIVGGDSGLQSSVAEVD